MSGKPTTIKERILMICEEQTVSKTKFFTQFGQSYSNFTGRDKKSPISSEFLTRMVVKYPNYNSHWILTGQGEMITVVKSESSIDDVSIENKDLKRKIELLEENLKEQNEIIETLKSN